jgi:hypothetical protein
MLHLGDGEITLEAKTRQELTLPVKTTLGWCSIASFLLLSSQANASGLFNIPFTHNEPDADVMKVPELPEWSVQPPTDLSSKAAPDDPCRNLSAELRKRYSLVCH